MLLNLSALPADTNFYRRLRAAAVADDAQLKKLTALEITLNHFKVKEGRDTVAEAMLRLDAIYGRRLLPRGADTKSKTLFKMYSYFVGRNS